MFILIWRLSLKTTVAFSFEAFQNSFPKKGQGIFYACEYGKHRKQLFLTEGFGTSRPLQLAHVECEEEYGCMPV
jgi:hypothetical protein